MTPTLSFVLFLIGSAACVVAGYAAAMSRWHGCAANMFDELAEVGQTQRVTSGHLLDAWERHMPGHGTLRRQDRR